MIESCDTGHLKRILPLLRELNDHKRLYFPATENRSLAGVCYPAAWASILESDTDAPWVLTARLVAATRLGGIDSVALTRAGLSDETQHTVFRDALAEQRSPLGEALHGRLEKVSRKMASWWSTTALKAPHWWIDRLAATPRAGATAPGKPRLVLEPAEDHAEHCLIVAVYGLLLAPAFDADPADAWLIGLAHHFHNATLPDAGFTGEVLLGDALPDSIETLRRTILQTLPSALGHRIEGLFAEIESDASPLAKTFHAADSIDRVLQMQHFANQAGFELRQATEDLELVHEGPVHAFQVEVLSHLDLVVGSRR